MGAYPNLEWPWLIRGVIPSERLVLAVLSRAANEQGNVSKYSVQGMREKIPELKRRAIQKILAALIHKGFVIDRIRRSKLGKYTVMDHPKGQQISNAFQLDFKRRFPRDTTNPAARLWKEIVTGFRDEHVSKEKSRCSPKFECRETRTITEMLRPEYPVWYERDEAIQRTKRDKRTIAIGLLCVHCESERAARFAELHLSQLIAVGEKLDPPVHAFKITFPKF